MFGDAAARAGGARRTPTRRRRCRSTQLQALAAGQPAQLSGADGARRGRCARPDSSTRRCRRSSAPRRSCRWPPATTARTRRWRRSRSRRRTRARAIAELEALMAVDFNNVEAARKLADCCARPASTIRRSSSRSTSASSRSIRSTPTRTPTLGRLAHAAQRRRRARRASSARCSRSDRSTRRRPTPISARATSRAASAPKRRRRRSRRSRSRPSYERAQDLLLEAGGCGMSRDVAALRRRSAVAASALFTLVPALQPRGRRAAAGGRGRPLRRPAVALRPHPSTTS